MGLIEWIRRREGFKSMTSFFLGRRSGSAPRRRESELGTEDGKDPDRGYSQGRCGEVRDHLDLTSAQRRGGILVGHRDKLRGGQPEALERGTVLGQQQAVRRSADPASREVAWLGDIGVGGYDAGHRAALRHNGHKAGGGLGAPRAGGPGGGGAGPAEGGRSEERRVGEGGRSRGGPRDLKKK